MLLEALDLQRFKYALKARTNEQLLQDDYCIDGGPICRTDQSRSVRTTLLV